MLNALSEWTGRWRLKVNATKTKIVHFRRSRTTLTDYEFKYGDKTIELVDSYKYLGCYLDEHLNFHKCSQILADSGGRALGGIITKFRSLKDTGYKTYTKLFDTGVVPVLNYGSEIWGYGRFEKCDYIMNRAMRFFLGVHKFAPTCGVQGDMGWLSMKYRRYIKILKFWNRLIKMDDSRLTKRVFLFYYDRPGNNWCSDVRNIATELDILDSYDNKQIFDISMARLKCITQMSEDWVLDLNNKPKLRTYKLFKDELSAEPYVKYYVPKCERSIFAQLRLGILALCIETGRFVNTFDPVSGLHRKLKVEERLCKLCNTNATEDEFHFLFACPKYVNERQKLFNYCKTSIIDFEELNDIEKIKYLMNVEWKNKIKFVIEIWNVRKRSEFV